MIQVEVHHYQQASDEEKEELATWIAATFGWFNVHRTWLLQIPPEAPAVLHEYALSAYIAPLDGHGPHGLRCVDSVAPVSSLPPRWVMQRCRQEEAARCY